MAGTIRNFHQGTTKRFQLVMKINNAPQDITNDAVSFLVKENKNDDDTDAVISKSADVATYGADGIAVFELSPSETNVPVRLYYCDVKWVLAGGAEYIVYDNTIKILERVSEP